MKRILVAAALAGTGLSFAGCAGYDAPRGSEVSTSAGAETEPGHTVTGEVESFTSDSVTLGTTTGNAVFRLTPETTGREHLVVGHDVAVDFQRTAGGEPIATRIRPSTGAGAPGR